MASGTAVPPHPLLILLYFRLLTAAFKVSGV